MTCFCFAGCESKTAYISSVLIDFGEEKGAFLQDIPPLSNGYFYCSGDFDFVYEHTSIKNDAVSPAPSRISIVNSAYESSIDK